MTCEGVLLTEKKQRPKRICKYLMDEASTKESGCHSDCRLRVFFCVQGGCRDQVCDGSRWTAIWLSNERIAETIRKAKTII